ncbi:aldo/keto reductase [Streptosporangium saharense]|uniref:aldo/keto reductase n=1 Tax=Streptosporangium saharense TaxID=1706840 RepID=UPI00367F1CBE
MADPRVVLGLHRSHHERRILIHALDLGITHIDTAFSYRSFTSHKILAAVAHDLLDHLVISTKVGFFPTPHGARHSLEPELLAAALRQTNEDLGRPPDLVFLHNPERSLHTDPAQAREQLREACVLMEEETRKGVCRSWGIASWNPTALPGLLDAAVPQPSALMIRAGLLVSIHVLDASAEIASHWELRDDAVWGMSPFGGATANLPLDIADPRLFLTDDARSTCSRLQAAFQAAYHLPRVSRIAVGTNAPSHLKELVEARHHNVDLHKIQHYLNLLRRRPPITDAGAQRQAVPLPHAPTPTADQRDAREGRRSSPDRTAS